MDNSRKCSETRVPLIVYRNDSFFPLEKIHILVDRYGNVCVYQSWVTTTEGKTKLTGTVWYFGCAAGLAQW